MGLRARLGPLLCLKNPIYLSHLKTLEPVGAYLGASLSKGDYAP